MDVSGYYLTNKNNKQFAAVLVQSTQTKCDYCLIHSHGNSPDIGIMLDTYLDLCFNMGINVIGYDYAGYG